MSNLEHLTPENCAILLIDHSDGFVLTIGSGDRTAVTYGAVALAKMAKLFDVPLIATNAPPEGPGGPLVPQLMDALGDTGVIVRPEGPMDSMDDPGVKAAVAATGRKKIVLAGVLTEVCATFTTISALSQGYEVYLVTDACGGLSPESHKYGIERMMQAGAIPVSWTSVLAELQRKWGGAKAATAPGVVDIITASNNNWSHLNSFYAAFTPAPVG
ncbi:isochorismatase family protein [Nocardia yamanashiensis]|uniref:isochorismatase family protein n=1 Tax=Nocardia yamanashiensis TaxID=209247 RepID=UPI00082EE32D|nr:isochorismatase family protein [Nocardia yamanashiensis]